MEKEIVALVPVKANSERVKQKNLRQFADTNLYELKLKQLQKARGFSAKIVSSEDEKILDTAKKYGFETHERNPKYSTSDVPMSDVYSNIASEVTGENIAWINVTSPLAQTEVYENAIKEFNKLDSKHDCLLSAVEVKDYLFYNGNPINFKSNPWPKSQDLKGLTNITFVVNILKRQNMIQWGSCVGESPYFYYLDSTSSMDIDFPEDFEFCEYLYKKKYL